MRETPEAILQRGHAAQSLLDSDIFNGVCDDLLKGYALRWLATNEREIREREEMHSKARAIEALRDELKARVGTAKKLEADQERAEKRKREI